MASLIELVKDLRERTGAGFADCKKALEATGEDLEKAIDWLREKGIAKTAAKAGRVAAEGLAKVVVNGNKAAIVEVNSETDFTARNDMFKKMVDTVAETILNSNATTVEEALELPTANGKLSDEIAAISFATGEKMTLRRFELINKTDDQIFGQYLHFDGKKGCVVVLNGNKEEVAKNIAMQIVGMNAQYVDRDSMPAEIVEHERAVQTEIVKNDEKNANKPEAIIAKMVEGKISKSLKDMCLVEQDYLLDPSMNVKTYLANNGMSIEKFVRYSVGEGIEKKKDNWVEEVQAALKG